MKARLLIADDHEIIRRGLRSLLELRPDWEICGEAATGREAVQQAKRLRPDVVVLDLTMPDLNGLEATRQIRQLLPKTEVLILTAHESEQLVHEVLSAGAKGYVLKSDAGNLLIAAVEQLLKHKPFFSSRISEMVLKAYVSPPGTGGVDPAGAAHLTRREREVVQLIAEGKSSKEIAGLLEISVETAETHRSNLMRKMKFHSAADVVRYAIRNQMIQP